MWRLNQEDGAVAVIVGVLLVVLFGIGALVVDVGNLYWERRQLQTGAEAAALSAAQDYATGNGGAARTTAESFATANNRRGAFVDEYIPDLTAQEVTVTTRTGDQSAEGVLDSILASAIGNDDYFARARATAAWGFVGSARTIPLTFGMCEWLRFTDGLGADALPTDALPVFHSPGVDDCTDVPSGLDYPGGFGWLDVANAEGNYDGICAADVSLGAGGAHGTTGNTRPQPATHTGCDESFFNGLIGETVLMPIFTDVVNGSYTIAGFAALEVTGYRVSGSMAAGTPIPCSNPQRCLAGRFVEYFDVDNPPSAGGDDFGVVAIALTE